MGSGRWRLAGPGTQPAAVQVSTALIHCGSISKSGPRPSPAGPLANARSTFPDWPRQCAGRCGDSSRRSRPRDPASPISTSSSVVPALSSTSTDLDPEFLMRIRAGRWLFICSASTSSCSGEGDEREMEQRHELRSCGCLQQQQQQRVCV